MCRHKAKKGASRDTISSTLPARVNVNVMLLTAEKAAFGLLYDVPVMNELFFVAPEFR